MEIISTNIPSLTGRAMAAGTNTDSTDIPSIAGREVRRRFAPREAPSRRDGMLVEDKQAICVLGAKISRKNTPAFA